MNERNNTITFMIIDIENKTSEELKNEVYERVKREMDKKYKDTISKYLNGREPVEDDKFISYLEKDKNNTITKMMKQFNYQIDNLIEQRDMRIKSSKLEEVQGEI